MIGRRVAMSVSLFAGLAGGCASSALPAAPAAPATTTTALASPSAPASPLPASQAPSGLPGSWPQSIPPTDTDLEPGTYAFDFPLMDQPGRPFPRVLIHASGGLVELPRLRLAEPRRHAARAFRRVLECDPRLFPPMSVEGPDARPRANGRWFGGHPREDPPARRNGARSGHSRRVSRKVSGMVGSKRCGLLNL